MSTPQTTHWDGCATDGGPAHYECAVGRIRGLEAELLLVRGDLKAEEMGQDNLRRCLAATEAERNALRVGAERYEEVRRRVVIGGGRVGINNFTLRVDVKLPDGVDALKGSIAGHFDAAIDAARKERKECSA